MNASKTKGLTKIELNPSSEPLGTIIWLHGLGADGRDFVPIVSELNLPEALGLRFVFPNAPERPVTINQGYVMRAWYDIVAMQLNNHADHENILESVQLIENLIDEENALNIPNEKIILAGFSQGAVIALHTALLSKKKFAGVIGLSGYLPEHDYTFKNTPGVNRDTPIFLAHGTEDTLVPFFLGETMHTLLVKQGFKVDWHAYQMGHSVCGEEVRDITSWISKVI